MLLFFFCSPLLFRVNNVVRQHLNAPSRRLREDYMNYALCISIGILFEYASFSGGLKMMLIYYPIYSFVGFNNGLISFEVVGDENDTCVCR